MERFFRFMRKIYVDLRFRYDWIIFRRIRIFVVFGHQYSFEQQLGTSANYNSFSTCRLCQSIIKAENGKQRIFFVHHDVGSKQAGKVQTAILSVRTKNKEIFSEQ
jgi:hypothetical protein